MFVEPILSSFFGVMHSFFCVIQISSLPSVPCDLHMHSRAGSCSSRPARLDLAYDEYSMLFGAPHNEAS